MTLDQLREAVAEFDRLKNELTPVAEGFGLEGLVLTVSSKDKLWECSEVALSSAGALILTQKRIHVEQDVPAWCRTYLDPTVVMSVEFEIFPEK